MRWAECYSALLQRERMRDKREQEKGSERGRIRERMQTVILLK